MVDENNVLVTDEILRHQLREFKESGVWTMSKVCEKYNITKASLLQMVKTKMVSSFRLTDDNESEILFLKSDLEKEMTINLVKTTRKDRLKLAVLGEKILTVIMEVRPISKEHYNLFCEYYFTDNLIEDIALKYGMPVKKAEGIVDSIQEIFLNSFRSMLTRDNKTNKVEAFHLLNKSNLEDKKKIMDSLALLQNNINNLFNEEKKEDVNLKTKIVDLDISIRLLNCLKAGNIETLADLISYQKHDLLKIRNFGKRSLTEVEDLLISKGLKFGSND